MFSIESLRFDDGYGNGALLGGRRVGVGVLIYFMLRYFAQETLKCKQKIRKDDAFENRKEKGMITLLEAFDENIIDDKEFMLLYDLTI